MIPAFRDRNDRALAVANSSAARSETATRRSRRAEAKRLSETRLAMKVVMYGAAGCHLCERAREVLRAELGDGFEEIDITGVDELEARYREWLPVVEIDGARAFVYFVDPGALRRKLAS